MVGFTAKQIRCPVTFDLFHSINIISAPVILYETHWIPLPLENKREASGSSTEVLNGLQHRFY